MNYRTPKHIYAFNTHANWNCVNGTTPSPLPNGSNAMGKTRLIAFIKIYTTPHEPQNDDNTDPIVRFKSFALVPSAVSSFVVEEDSAPPPPRTIRLEFDENISPLIRCC